MTTQVLGRRRSLVLAACAGLWVATAAAQPAPDTRLPDAAMRRDLGTVRALLRERADPNVRGAYETPALLWVVRVGDLPTVDALLAAGADPNLTAAHGVAALHLAVENADLEVTRRLLDAGAAVDFADATGETALFVAARVGAADVAKLLIERGAEVDRHEPSYTQTPLHVATRADSVAVAKLLVAYGADVNARTLAGDVPSVRMPSQNTGSKGLGINRGGVPDRGGRGPVQGAKTPLLYATRVGSVEMTRLLLDAGADLEQTDENGIAPLLNTLLNASVGIQKGRTHHFGVAQLLIERGANVNAGDWYGETPLWAAVDVRNCDVDGATRDNGVDRAAALDTIAALLEHGAQPNARTKEYPPERRFITRLGSLAWVNFTGQTPFLRAALAGDVTVMKLLLEHGADPNLATDEGTTPLMAAAGVNWVYNQTYDEGPDALLAAVDLTRSLGNDVDAVNSMGLRAIHGAANRGSNAIVAYLAEHGARLDAADKQGRTPEVWAEGVFLATHPPVRKPETLALLESLHRETGSAADAD